MLAGVSSHDYAVLKVGDVAAGPVIVQCSFVSGGSHNAIASTLALFTAAPRLQAAEQKSLRVGLILANEMKHIKYAVKSRDLLKH